MPVSRLLPTLSLFGLLAGALAASPALAASQPEQSCLTRAEQRASVAANKAISLAQAIKFLRNRGHRSEVVRARLCRHDETLVYVLTLLGSNGKVTSVNVDAGNGELITGR
jgi:uncharacterized membrane protein YkoI